MCVLAIAWQVDPRWPIVFAGNRDERHDRATMPLHAWIDPAGILAGRDEVAGGTWLGIADGGRLATVTNVRTDDGFAASGSRGALVVDALLGHANADPALYNPFNLLVLDAEDAAILTNWPAPRREALRPGIHALSNGTLDEPCAKGRRLSGRLEAWLEVDGRNPSDLLDTLHDEHLSDPTDPRSAIFIRDTVYGTRSSSVVAVDANGGGVIIERRFGPDGMVSGETALLFIRSAMRGS